MTEINDMYYAWSSDKEILENGECGGAITSFLKYLLEENIVNGVLAVKKGSDIYDAVPTLITDPDKIIETAGSLHCGTLNIAKTLGSYLNGAKDVKIAVTAKPCDAMSIIELMKRNQINKDNVIMVGINCGGTMPPVKAREMIDKFYEINPDDVLKEEIAKGKLIIETKDGEKEISIDELEDQGYGRRTNCRRCDVNIPRMADLAFGNWGVIGPKAGEATFVEIFSEKGAEYFNNAIKKGVLNAKDPDKKGIEIRDNIDKIMTKLSKKWQDKDFDKKDGDLLTIDNYMGQLNKCIKCYGCREGCPLCFCKECSLESQSPEWVPKGVVPPSPMFHWVRLLHVVDSCTNCGQCEEVCPMEIPLSKIYHSINVQLQETFGYHPGMDINQKPPLSIIDKEPSEE